MKIVFILFILADINPHSITAGISFIFDSRIGFSISYKINIPVKIQVRAKAKPPFCIRYFKTIIAIEIHIVNTIYVNSLISPAANAINRIKLGKGILSHTKINPTPQISFFQRIPGTIIKTERMTEGLLQIRVANIDIQWVCIYTD